MYAGPEGGAPGQFNPLETNRTIKSGSFSARGGRCKRSQEAKSSQGKDGEGTSKDKYLLNGSEGHSDLPSVLHHRSSPVAQ